MKYRRLRAKYSRGEGADILVKHLFKHGHGSDDPWLPAGREGVKLHIGRDEGSCELGVCSGAGATTSNTICDEVNLRTPSVWRFEVDLL